jgi:myo-inositol-1(or 4)-monophosphatase
MNDTDGRILEMAMLAARAGGEVVRERFGKILTVVSPAEKKSLTTDADIEAQKEIVSVISKEFPDHLLIAEEGKLKDYSPGSGYTWIIDPLDGSINFYHQVPLFCVAIGVLKDKKPHTGIIYNPIADELFWAQNGKGGFDVRGKRQPLETSDETALAKSVIMTHLTSTKEQRVKVTESGFLETIVSASRHVRMLGSGQLALAFVASGKFQVFLNNFTYPWDQLAGVVLVKAAGGVVTDFFGNEWTWDSPGILACNNEKIHSQMLELTRKHYPS